MKRPRDLTAPVTLAVALAFVLLEASPAQGAEYQLIDGQGAVEAENYSSVAVDTTAPINTWTLQTSPSSGLLSGASGGQYMVTTPDIGTVNGYGNGDGTKPWLLYEFRIPEGQAPADYIAYVRGNGSVSPASDSAWAIITDADGNYLGGIPTGTQFSGLGWNWAPSPVVTLTPGDYFVRVIMREDGAPIDKITLQLADTSLVAVPTGLGPSQSPAVTSSTDTDGDGIPDATENADGDPWTDPNVFNGMDVRLAPQCTTTPTCSTNDTIAEVNQCMAVTLSQEQNQSAGWNWSNPPDNSCSLAYDFQPNWSSCRSTWQTDWKGFINVRQDGYQCFAVAGLPDKGCASLYFHSDQIATVQTGGLPECEYRAAGVYPVQWHYTMAAGSQSSMQVNYCFGGASKCMPSAPIPSSMLRPSYSGCVPTTCYDAGAECGTISDGCGGTLNCDQQIGGCHGSDTCGGGGTPNQCGCTGSNCCTVGVDSDGDGIDDCTEKSDGDAWTDSEIFNGMHARLADHCHAAPASSLTDTLAEVNQCMTTTIHDEKDQSSGWSWQDGADSACSASYNFSLPWSHCQDNWQVDWKGFIKLDNTGTYCFDVLGTENSAAGSIFFNTQTTAATYASGPKCYPVSAGIYPIQWYFEMADGSQSDFRVAYCYTRDGTSCDPVDAVPSSALRTQYKGTENPCDPNSTKCTDLCPCRTGQGTCQSDSQCIAGSICGQSNGSFFGQPGATNICWGAICTQQDPTLFCGTPASACGSTCFAAAPCSTNADCASGEVCGSNNGSRFESPPGIGNVCWPASCQTDPVGTGCGGVTSPCGKCECVPNCSGASCGASTSDGCSGKCAGFCGDRQAGCTENADCVPGDACVIAGGTRVGLAEGTNVCLPLHCADLDTTRITDCGSTTSTCGLCPDCVPLCAGRECGLDPRCGVDCGTLNGGTAACGADACTAGGTCIATETVSNIQVPTDTGTRDVPPLASPGTQPVGTVDGEFSVSDRGTAVYSIPVAVPPGRAGVQPSLSVRYESSKSNGLLGVGWSLDGLSMISRCPQTVASEGWAQPIDYGGGDRYCLDGKRLVPVNGGVNGADGTEYRTELDTFAKVISHSQPGIADVGYFEVHTKDARVLTYGNTEDSSLYAQEPGVRGGNGVKRAWALSHVEDLAGDGMDISYGKLEVPVVHCNKMDANGNYEDPTSICATEEIWPVQITYGGVTNSTAQEPNDRTIAFSYTSDRSDRLEGYAELGVEITRSRLLNQIDTYAGARHARRYGLSYQPGASGLNRLESVTECEDDGTTLACKAPATFSYFEAGGLLPAVDTGVQAFPGTGSASSTDRSSQVYFGSYNGPIPPTSTGPLVLDWNGDGRDDILYTSSIPSNFSEQPTLGDGFSFTVFHVGVLSDLTSGTSPTFSNIDTGQNTSDACDQTLFLPGGVGDLDRSGTDDLLTVLFGECNGDQDHVDFQSGYEWWKAAQSPPFARFGLSIPPPIGQNGAFVASFATDVNGDGLLDVFGYDSAAGNICYNQQLPQQDGEFSINCSATDPQCAAPFTGSPPLFNTTCDSNPPPFSGGSCSSSDATVLYDFAGVGRPTLFQHDCRTNRWAALRAKPPGSASSSPNWTWDDISGPFIGQGGVSNPNNLGLSSDPSRLKIIDLNADGAPDILELADPGNADVTKSLAAFLNRRNGRAFAVVPIHADETSIVWNEKNFSASLVLDYDGDGRQDLVVPTEDVATSGNWILYRNDPTAIFLKEAQTIHLVAPKPASGSSNQAQVSAVVGDFNGDGRDDVGMVASNGNMQIALADGAPGDLLGQISNGIGQTISISYDPGGGGESLPTYTPLATSDDQRCPATSRCLRRMPHLVSSYQVFETNITPAAQQLQKTVTFHYSDAREGILGQGWLGFAGRTIEELDGSGELVQDTAITYDNSNYDSTRNIFRFAGRVTNTSTSGPTISTLLSSGLFGLIGRSSATETTWALATSDAGIPFAYPQTSVTVVTEGSNLYQIQDQITSIDPYGNVEGHNRDVHTLSSPGSVATVTATTTHYYLGQDRIDEWATGLPDRVTIIDERSTGDQKTRTTSFSFDEAARLATITKEPDDPARTLVISFSRDNFGNVEDMLAEDTTGDGRPYGIHYDDRGLFPTLFEDPNNHQTQVRFDDATGQILTKADPNGIVEQWAYDGFGRLRRHVAPGLDEQTDYSYAAPDSSAFFLVPAATNIRRTVQGGAVETRDFDPLGRLVRLTTSGFNGSPVQTEVQYNQRGLVAQRSRPHLNGDLSQGLIGYGYDARGRLTSEARPDGSTVGYSYASIATIDSSLAALANAAGATDVRSVTDPNGNTTVSATDPFGNVVGTQDALGHVTKFYYGAFTQLDQVVDSKGNTNSFVYDQLSQLLSQSDVDRGSESMTYDGFGDLKTHTDGNGTTRTYFYDAEGRLFRVADPDGTTLWTYDGGGPDEIDRLVNTQSPSGHQVTYKYEARTATDNRGFLTTVTYSDAQVTSSMDFSYNAFGDISSIAYPSVAGDRLTINETYDGFGHLASVQRAGSQNAVQYWSLLAADQGLRIKTEQLGNGVQTVRTYDPFNGSVKTIATTTSSPRSTIQQIAYTYYPNLNMQTRTETESLTDTLSFDALNRYTGSHNAANEAESYGYDELGNITGNTIVGAYQYNGTSPHAVTQAGSDTFSYFPNGDMETRSGPDISGGTQTFSYTAFSLPKTVTSGSGTASFEYTATEERVLKTNSEGDATRYIPDLYERRTQSAAPGSVEHVFRIFAAGREIADVQRVEQNGAITSENTVYLHDDAVGSVNAITDSSGNRLVETHFHVFGQPSSSASSTGVTTGFTGQQQDDDLGLVNMRGRLYDPLIGRFTTPDPFVQAPFSQQSWNRYAYAFNNPLQWVDPSGFDGEEADDGGGLDDESGYPPKVPPWFKGDTTTPDPSDPYDPAPSSGGALGSPPVSFSVPGISTQTNAGGLSGSGFVPSIDTTQPAPSGPMQVSLTPTPEMVPIPAAPKFAGAAYLFDATPPPRGPDLRLAAVPVPTDKNGNPLPGWDPLSVATSFLPAGIIVREGEVAAGILMNFLRVSASA